MDEVVLEGVTELGAAGGHNDQNDLFFSQLNGIMHDLSWFASVLCYFFTCALLASIMLVFVWCSASFEWI